MPQLVLAQGHPNSGAFGLGAGSLELSTSVGSMPLELSLSLAPELQLSRLCELLLSLRSWTGAGVS